MAASGAPHQADSVDGLRELITRALAEDIGTGDLTTDSVVPAEATARATIVQKVPGVIFGFEAASEAMRQVGAEGFEVIASEGEWREEVPLVAASLSGPGRSLLAAERTALNFLCHLSGIATLTARFVRAVEGTGVEILDTRKTTPGLRTLEKAAVRAGGGRNHRMGLADAVLIKENHIALAGRLGHAVRSARAAQPELSVEVECRTLEEVVEALDVGADRLLLDNLDPQTIERAVKLCDAAARAHGPAATVEASGGVTLENVAAIAAAGPDFISVGALTHSAPALDLSMNLERSAASHG